ncbi:hypothetical protein MSSAC_1822 [Methanosarcina siciliae C2J]|uniref:Transposase IS4-like domain-containing protein n=1 Tax=Methanosarcina siciliae C2J TaxID=1434118 RepID=A0A0E3PMR8_9EURY|nr:hypothetical protein MSSAC_1822 [Methanosarcina siciliae C2J]
MMLGEKILKLSQEKEAKIDSTPLEASRYDKHDDYNPHYECKMDKSHITMIGTYPVYNPYKRCCRGFSRTYQPYEALKKTNADIELYSADGGYDSFLNHSDIWYHLNAKPIISYASNAVINEEGKEERIDHRVNKMWKIGGDIHATMENKLKYLYENGREEQVGMYLRNQNISDEGFDEQYKKRSECEKVHGHIKDTVKFDIRRERNKSRKLYSLLSFIAYQLLVLTEIQNKTGNKNSFERYF